MPTSSLAIFPRMVKSHLSYFVECLKIVRPEYIYQQNQMEDIECVFESVSGCGSLFISNHAAAQNLSLLQSKGIRAVLSVARSGLVIHRREDIPHYLYIPAEDHEQYDISRHFQQTNDFIEKARKETNVLIHCMAGISRSVTVVIAYLLKRYRHTLGQVVTMLQRRRRKINPNKGFIDQLKKYCQQLGVRCDFQGECISPLRDSSASKQIRAYSAKKYQSLQKRPEMLAPLVQIKKDIKNARLSEIHIRHDQDRVPNQTKKDELQAKKSQNAIETSISIGQSRSNQKTSIQLDHALQIKKAFSTEQNSPQKKRSKIEQKIGKIRDRLLKSDSIPKKDLSRSMHGIQIQNKQNKNVKKTIFLQQINYGSIGPESSRLTFAKPSLSLKANASKIQPIISVCPEDVGQIKNSSIVNIEPRPFLSHARIQIAIRSDSHRWVS